MGRLGKCPCRNGSAGRHDFARGVGKADLEIALGRGGVPDSPLVTLPSVSMVDTLESRLCLVRLARECNCLDKGKDSKTEDKHDLGTSTHTSHHPERVQVSPRHMGFQPRDSQENKREEPLENGQDVVGARDVWAGAEGSEE